MKTLLFKILYCVIIFNCYSFGVFAQLLPIPDWVKDIGGTGESKTSGLAVDKDDNVYVSGHFEGTLTVGSGSSAISLTSVGNYDIFILKYSYDGQLIWATRFGGANLDQVNYMSVDINGNAYVACMTQSPSINSSPRQGSYDFNGIGQEALLVKIDTNGEFKWARTVGGSQDDAGGMADIDKAGNVIFVGSCSSSNVNLDGWIINSKGGKDGFIVKYNTNGDVIWAYTIASANDDYVYGVKVNSANEIAITGSVSTNANLNPKNPAAPSNIDQAYYIAKYTSDFNLIWSNTLVGSNNHSAGIALNGSDELYVTGNFSGFVSISSTVPANSITLNSLDGNNLYITKYSQDGDLKWVRQVKGNSSSILSYNIVADIDDNVYICGYFVGKLEFGDPPNNKVLTYQGSRDTFFGKYDAQGNFIWAFNLGSACFENYGHKITVDSKKNVLLGGKFCNTVDFNPGNCELNLSAQHYVSDAFVVKYNQVKLTGEPIVTSFTLAEQTASARIDVQSKTIEISVHPGTDLAKLKPNIMVDIGVTSPLSNTEQDFTSPKTYKISSNCMDYIWTVKVNLTQSQQTEVCTTIPFIVYGEKYLTPSPSFQWEIQDTDQNWINAPQISNLPDYNSPGIPNDTNDDQLIKFRRKITSNSIDSYDSEVHITIHPSISNNIISSSQQLNCEGKANVTINGLTPQAAQNSVFTFKWQQSADGITWIEIPNATNKDLFLPEFNQIAWFKRITLTNNCEAHSNQLKIMVYEKVTQSNAGTDIFLCQTPSVTLNANAVAENETGSWSIISPLGYQPFDSSNINNPNALIQNIPEDQEIVLQWTITPTVCPSSTAFVKILNYSKITNNTINVTTSSFCADIVENLTIEGTTPISAFGSIISYNWEKSTDGNLWETIPDSDLKDLTLASLSKSTYFRRVTNTNNCQNKSNELKINIFKPITKAIAGQSVELCGNTKFKLSANNFNENEEGSWSVVSPLGYNPFTSSNLNNPRAIIDNLPPNQEVIFKWTITNTTCDAISFDQMSVISYRVPKVTLVEKIVINYGESVNLNAVIDVNTSQNYTIEWSPSIGLNNPYTLNPKATPKESSTYTLTVHYGTSCHKTYQVYVLVVKDLEMSNAFSPNMDGINDRWIIKNLEGHPGAEVSIYNRYGTRIFYSNHYQSWDGTHKGSPVPTGTYYYIIRLNDDKKTILKGSVTIIR
ncbi:gliding motility-associated C-terminal domain-containing protein [Pedobacter nyackensis]|uniref:T9SS type B sorting domain-containing protein n=1 Tax=Pedobacter nyackensis TaxID=475255 RepID=UPI0029307F9F|nr:gliding motility-associated C-terminal domain-containing protein [Pedobacter nyackensis]